MTLGHHTHGSPIVIAEGQGDFFTRWGLTGGNTIQCLLATCFCLFSATVENNTNLSGYVASYSPGLSMLLKKPQSPKKKQTGLVSASSSFNYSYFKPWLHGLTSTLGNWIPGCLCSLTYCITNMSSVRT